MAFEDPNEIPEPMVPDSEHRIMQAETHHQEVSGLLDTLIQQNEKNNPEPILEAQLQTQDDIKNELVKQTEVLTAMKDKDENATQITSEEGTFTIKGKKGDKGDRGEMGPKPEKEKDYFTAEEIAGFKKDVTPVKGEDYFTDKEILEFVESATPVKGKDYFDGKEGKPGYTPVKNKDYFDGKEGPMGPVGKGIPGLPGKDGSPDSGDDIVKKLSDLPEERQLSFNKLKDIPNIFKKQSSRDYDFIELKDAPHSYAGQAGKVVKVRSDELGLEFGVGGGGGSGAIYNEQFTTNGVTTTFTLSQAPIAGTTEVFLNGSLQTLNDHYTVVGSNIVFNAAHPAVQANNITVNYNSLIAAIVPASPAAPDTAVQYNNGGAFGATDLVYDNATTFYGLGISPTSDTKLTLRQIFTPAAGTVYGTTVTAISDPSAIGTTVAGGYYLATSHVGNAFNFVSIIGFSALGSHEGDGVVAQLTGSLSQAYQGGNGVVTNLASSYNTITAAGTAAITNARGVYVATPQVIGGGSITNLYGLYLEPQNVGSTLNYAIYYNLPSNYFVVDGTTGYVGIGTDVPGFPLTVNGITRITQTQETGSKNLDVFTSVAPTANSGTTYRAASFNIRHASGAFNLTGAMRAAVFIAEQQVAGSTITEMSGFNGEVAVTNGTVTTGAAGKFSVSQSGGTYTTAIGIWAAPFTYSAGTLTTAYGAKIDPPGAGSTEWTLWVGTGNSTIQGTLLVPTIHSLNSASSTLNLQNQTFTAGALHTAVTIQPTWTAENNGHTAISINARQQGDNSSFLTGMRFTITKLTPGTTLGVAIGLDFGAPSVSGTITESTALNIGDQANPDITNPRGIVFRGTTVANSIAWGNSALQYSNGSNNIRFMDSTNARGLAMTLTAAGVQTLSTIAGNLSFASQTVMTDARFEEGQGADVASAGDLTLGTDGNVFEITGATQIDAITTADWQNGSMIVLLFTSNPVVKHNTAGGAGTAVILLSSGADFGATAGDTLTLLLSEIGGTQAWRELARTAI